MAPHEHCHWQWAGAATSYCCNDYDTLASTAQSQTGDHQVPRRCACAATACPVVASCSRDAPVRVHTSLQERSAAQPVLSHWQTCRFSRRHSRQRPQRIVQLRAHTKDERLVRLRSRLKWSHVASFVADSSTECGQPRHAWGDEAAQGPESHDGPFDWRSPTVHGHSLFSV
jgi:hypothetical protein